MIPDGSRFYLRNIKLQVCKRKDRKSRTPAMRGFEIDNMNQRTPRVKKRDRLRCGEILFQPSKGKSFAEVLGVIRHTLKPEDVGTEIKSVMKTRNGVGSSLSCNGRSCAKYATYRIW